MYVHSPVVTNIECSNKINQISVFIPTSFLNGVYTTMVYDLFISFLILFWNDFFY